MRFIEYSIGGKYVKGFFFLKYYGIYFLKFEKKSLSTELLLLYKNNHKIYHSRNTHSKMGKSGFDLNILSISHPGIEKSG